MLVAVRGFVFALVAVTFVGVDLLGGGLNAIEAGLIVAFEESLDVAFIEDLEADRACCFSLRS